MKTAIPAALIAAAPTLYRQGLVAILHERWPDLPITFTTDTTQLPKLIATCTFALLVLDGHLAPQALHMLLAQLYRARPTQRLVVLVDLRLINSTTQLVQTDIRLLLPHHVPPPVLANTLAPWLTTLSKGLVIAHRPQAQTCMHLFSPRELEVLRLVVADLCNQEIADRLFLSVRTVESHRRALLYKAGTRTLVGLAVQAMREGWVA